MIRQRNSEAVGLENQMRIDLSEYSNYFDQLVVPYKLAPVLVDDGEGQNIREMKFSMVPNWSKEPKIRFATHNARLESVLEKPTWKTVFIRRHCLVPMTHFIEPVYKGDYAGHMVAFSSLQSEMICAAGVWDEWVNRETGEVSRSFAILTYEAPPFVATVGHDRCPVFLNPEKGAEWLGNEGGRGDALKDFLLTFRLIPEMTVEKHRPMRPGWEKRK